MGLDGVEMLLDVEQTFGISIADAEAESLLTPRALISLVCNKLNASSDSVSCPSIAAFCLLRPHLLQCSGKKRSEIRPSTKLEALFPKKNRRLAWMRIQDAIPGTTLPALEWRFGKAKLYGYQYVSLIGFIALAAVAGNEKIVCAGIYILLIGLLLSIIFYAKISPHFSNDFPEEMQTVRQLVERAMLNRQKNSGEWTRSLVRLKCREIIRHHLGQTDFDDDAEFVRDLGMD